MPRGPPLEIAWIGATFGPKEMSMRHDVTPFPLSRQRKVGGVISGGKIDPSSG